MKRISIVGGCLCAGFLLVAAAEPKHGSPTSERNSPCAPTTLPKLCHIQDCTVNTSVDIVDFTNDMYQLSIDFAWLAPGHGEQHKLVFVQASPGKGRVETKRQGAGFNGAFTTLTAGLEVRDQTNSLIAFYDVTFVGHGGESSFTSGSVSFPHTRFWKDWAEGQKKKDSTPGPGNIGTNASNSQH
jgi:hypothetical protein